MLLREIAEILQAQPLNCLSELDIEIEAGFGADLLSDVLMFAKENFVLLTGLTNRQVITTADMVDARAVIFVRGKIPPPDVIAEAYVKRLPLLTTKYTLYEACGRLWSAGLAGMDSTRS